MSGPNLVRLFSAVVLISACVLATPQSLNNNSNIRFSKLLSQKSDLLKFTSISNTPPEARFHNVYNKAEEVQPSRSSSSQRLVEYPEARVITRAGPGEEFVRIGQSQVVAEEPTVEDEVDGTLTRINQKPVSGRTQVTALRQTSGKRLNISPVFPGKDDGSSVRRQSVVQPEESQHESDDPTASPDFDDTAEEEEVTTAQNTELSRETDTPPTTPSTTTTTAASFTRKESSVSVVTSAPRVTIFDNRTTDALSSTLPTTTTVKDDLENENLVLDTFHRKGHFPDFEDLPTHLATAESNQPARVNVRPASSGKDYEYEYIYYYYDDDDDDNSTTVKPALDGSIQVPKAELTGIKASNTFDSEKFPTSKFASDPSNSLDAQRGQKSYPLVPTTTVPLPLGNKAIVLKQSGLSQPADSEYVFPQVPRSGSVPITVPTTTPVPTTTRAPTRPTFVVPPPVQQQQERFSQPRAPAPVQINQQPHNRFSPPVQESREEPTVPQTRFPARPQSQEQFSRPRAPVPVPTQAPVVEPAVPQTRFPARPQSQEQFSRSRVPAPVQESVEEPEAPPTRFSAPTRSQEQFSRSRAPTPSPAPVNPTPQIRNKAQSQQAPDNDFAPPIIQIQLVSTEAPVEPTPRRPVYKELPSGRRINAPRRPQAEPELQQQAPQPASTTAAPVPVTEAAPAPRNPSQRNRFPSRGPPAGNINQDQFRAPLVPSRGSEPIVEIPAPELSTVSPTAEAEEKVKDNFARQKSINDLYALTRLHQLAINTRVPNRKQAEQAGQSYKGIPPKHSGGFINSAEVTTHFPDDNILSESTTISSYVPASVVSSGDFQRLITTTEEAPASSSTTEENEQRPGLRTKNNRFRGRNRGPSSTSSTTEAAPRLANPNRFAGRRRPFTPAAPAATSVSETGEEVVSSAAPQPPRVREQARNRFAGRTRPTTTTTEAGEPIHQDQEVVVSVSQPQPTQSQPQFPRRRPAFPHHDQTDADISDAPPQPTQSQFPRRRPVPVPHPDPTDADVSVSQPQPTQSGLPRRRPGPFQGRRRPSTPVPSLAPAPDSQSSPVEPSEVPIVPTNAAISSDDRRASFGKRGRARPNTPTNVPSSAPAVDQAVPVNRRPILGRPLRSRVSTTTTEVSEPLPAPTAVVIESQSQNENEALAVPSVEPSASAAVVPENIRVEGPEGGVIAQKVTVSSSTTTSESVEPPKRGSAGVLGRIRSRARPLVIQTTTVAPVVTVAERKPSRLNGILNRRKAPAGPTLTTTQSPLHPETEEAHSNDQEHQDTSPTKPKEIIVQVSSVVTESEETSEHHGEVLDEHSSTTQGSILNRLKAQRKPGSLYRKRVES